MRSLTDELEAARAVGGEVEELRAHVAELSSELEAARQAAREAEELRMRIAELVADLEAARATQSAPEPAETAHVLLVPSPTGYAVVEREGRCPDRGAEAEIEGRSFRVSRIGPSPLGDRRRCAYLEPAR